MPQSSIERLDREKFLRLVYNTGLTLWTFTYVSGRFVTLPDDLEIADRTWMSIRVPVVWFTLVYQIRFTRQCITDWKAWRESKASQPTASMAFRHCATVLLTMLLDRETREDVLQPALEEIRADRFRSMDLTGRSSRSALKLIFGFRLALLVCGCFLNMIKTWVVDFIAPIAGAFWSPGSRSRDDD